MLLPQTLAPEPRIGRSNRHTSNDSDCGTFDLDEVSVDAANSQVAEFPPSSDPPNYHHLDLLHGEFCTSVDGDGMNCHHRHHKSVLDARMAQCGYPLQNVNSQVDEHQITLDGHVSRYYYMQVVIQIAKRVCGGRQIVNNLDVVSVTTE